MIALMLATVPHLAPFQNEKGRKISINQDNQTGYEFVKFHFKKIILNMYCTYLTVEGLLYYFLSPLFL